MRSIVLAYHEPGDPSGHSIMSRLARSIESAARERVVATTFDALESAGIDGCEAGFILTLARGGHYYEALRSLTSKCARVYGPVPTCITATHLASGIAWEGQCPARIVYHEGRRFRREQAEDYWSIARLATIILASLGLNCPLEVSGHRSGASGLRISLLPGRSPGAALLGGEPGFSLVREWILETLRLSRPPS